MRKFLGIAGFCSLWTLGFAELARTLYEATKEEQDILWAEYHQQAFDKLQQSLILSPALGLPDVTKPLHLVVDEHKRIAS